MSIWGNDIYQNDTASDYAAEIGSKCINDIEEVLEEEDDLDFCDLALILPPIDILCYLLETKADINLFSQCPNLNAWENKILKAFDDDMEELGWPQKDIEEYRENITSLLKKFSKLTKQ